MSIYSNRHSPHLNNSSNRLQQTLQMLLENVKKQLLQSNILKSQTQFSNIFLIQQSLQQNQNEPEDKIIFYVQNFSSVINFLIALMVQQQEQNGSMTEALQKNIQTNDIKILEGMQIFVDLTQKMADFSKQIYRQTNKNQQKQLSVQIYKNFRQVYQLTQQLSGIFNDYTLSNEQLLKKKDQLISLQIKLMQDVFLDQQRQRQDCQDYSMSHPSQASTPIYSKRYSEQTQSYILSLNQQISELHQTLFRNDEQFTHQIQNYNKTLRQMSNTIKAYELQLLKLTQYQMRIQQLEQTIIRNRQQRYRNQIIIENMAKKIRNYEKQLKGDKSFVSPHRQKLVSSPQTRFSMINSKVSSALSVGNPINNNVNSNYVNANGNINGNFINSRNNLLSNTNLLSPKTRKSFF